MSKEMTIETLRAQRNQNGMWRIVKKSKIGSWRMFGGSHGYATKELCQAKIDYLVVTLPDQYKEG